MMYALALLVAALASPGAPQEPELPKVLFFANPMRSDNDVVRRPRPGGPLGRRATLRRAEQGGLRRHDHPGRRRGHPREARPLQGRRLLHGDQPARRGRGRARRLGPRRRGVRRHPLHRQHLPGPSRLRRHARRRLRPAPVADRGGPADEGPGEGRGPDAPGDAAPGGVVRDRRRHLPVQGLRPRQGAAAAEPGPRQPRPGEPQGQPPRTGTSPSPGRRPTARGACSTRRSGTGRRPGRTRATGRT